ncbi:small, acid-soluble spore protein, alpha/beta type [Alkalihalobacillus deserti]|nr:small, acid-soluble spore protein, alpha/beta type [Alkalihalobacillus deserti]
MGKRCGQNGKQLKREVAHKLGVQLDADATGRSIGSVGGKITKRLVQN